MTLRPSRPSLVLIGAMFPIWACCLGVWIAPACGGSRSAAPLAREAGERMPDPGSGPIDCNVVNPYEMLFDGTHGENFEFGAATGWYTNNEVCYPWTQATTECAEAGMVCYPGSQATIECQRDGAPVGVWSSCFGSGSVDCADAASALAPCQKECLDIQPSPSFSADQLPAEPIPNGGRCGSLYALHVRAGPFLNWGGNVGTRFPQPFDASSYDGIAVWMRTAPGFANAPTVTLSDQYTDSQYNQARQQQHLPVYCDPNPNCQVQTSQGNANCYNVGCDTFGVYVPLTENWRLFLLPFDEMRQGGWGRQRPQLELSALLSVQVSFP
ncbi:MAG: hypothetical protein M3O46_12855, partial [Myxococcota bacterium]|nr:hypothetical protein [Myxococcota bacterium]